jgi:hypothetical protein
VAFEHVENLFEQALPWQYSIDEIRSVEVADKHFRVAQVQLVDDVPSDRLRGRRRERVERRLGESLAQTRELPVLGAKVVAPMADAVSLVDGERPHSQLAQEVLEPFRHNPLGRDEQQAHPAHPQLAGDVALVRFAERGIDANRRHIGRGQRVHLIFHQRDEWRDDDGRFCRPVRGRRLVAERLAAARRHDDE